MKHYPESQMVFARCAAGLVAIAPFVLTAGRGTLKISRPWPVLVRCAFSTIGFFAGFYAFAHLPLAQAQAISFSRVLFIVILAAWFLREKIAWRRWTAVAVGFIGVIVMARPTSASFDLATLLDTALRLAPDRLIVGEVRGREALPLVHALNAACDGAVVAVSGDGANAALGRLATLAGEGGAAEGPIRELVAQAFEIVVHVTRWADGAIRVRALGGLYPWKIGEGPVQLLVEEPIPGVLSVGSIHTETPLSPAVQAKETSLTWSMVRVRTGLPLADLLSNGVRPGTRVVLAPDRRRLFPMGDLVAGPFLDDRADVVAMLRAMESIDSPEVVFIATVAEEVGGHGALWALQSIQPEICIALELSPIVPDAPILLSATPALWVTDSYANMPVADIDLVADLGLAVQYQALGRGGSDASCAASEGLVARPFTLGIPMENSHGFEIMHRDGPEALAALTVALINRLTE
jgi:putative aminopeptidase FrvX/uncharacterized membrane protein